MAGWCPPRHHQPETESGRFKAKQTHPPSALGGCEEKYRHLIYGITQAAPAASSISTLVDTLPHQTDLFLSVELQSQAELQDDNQNLHHHLLHQETVGGLGGVATENETAALILVAQSGGDCIQSTTVVTVVIQMRMNKKNGANTKRFSDTR